jgi:hypothetical protein
MTAKAKVKPAMTTTAGHQRVCFDLGLFFELSIMNPSGLYRYQRDGQANETPYNESIWRKHAILGT